MAVATRAPVRFVTQLVRKVLDDNVLDEGAMMAFYTVLALFPMIVFVVTLALLVIDSATVHQGVQIATKAMPDEVRALISRQVSNLIDAAGAKVAIGGALLALWGASRGAVALGHALNATFGRRETRGWVRRQLVAIGVTVAVAVMIVLALGLLVIGPTVGHLAADRFGLGGAFDAAWGVGRWFGAGLLVMAVCGVAYKFLPDTDAPFRLITPGAIVGVVSWLAISFGFGIYLSHWGRYETTYGTLGGAIVFLTWLWLSNIALLIGAEVNAVLAATREAKPAAG
jgi:membrane protein